jgi:hypothetical protein
MVGTGVASRRYGHGGLGWEGRQRGERSGGGWRNWLGLRALGAYIVEYSRVREKAWGFGRWRSSGCEPPETWRPSTARDRWLREKVLEWGAGSWGSLGRSRAGQGASGAGLLGARVATRASRGARPCGSLLTSGSRKRRARRGHPRKGRASLLFSLAPTSSLRWTPVERSCKGDGAEKEMEQVGEDDEGDGVLVTFSFPTGARTGPCSVYWGNRGRASTWFASARSGQAAAASSFDPVHVRD